ncbi:hypothetical protein [Nocardioides gansuensis]|uniref:hypothetical protein n=1 Tax=Nocardioides gansuensis TaxID=2138300 RepID=UPI0014040D5F|nr:hypothetical protein [Nocardioides gansuensis]
MTWHTTVVPTDALAPLLATIRTHGGTITNSRPDPNGIYVTWTTTTDSDLAGAGTR